MTARDAKADGAVGPATTSRVRVLVGVGDGRDYEIVIGTGALTDPATYSALPVEARVLIVSDATVAPLYADSLMGCLADRFRAIGVLVLPEGEAEKTWATLDRIFDALIEANADRKVVVFALGGGVVGDVAGFAAACYMRGVSYVQVPTTLLAQVDSSIGGKTAINHPRGKNMIGAFHQPSLVVADLAVLDTLPHRQLVAGLAEVVKSAFVADASFVHWIEANLDALLARDKDALAYAVECSCRIKAAIVAKDEREGGVRAVLNFGHTFGHAIETAAGYGHWLHGEAVGCGMLLALDLSARLGLIDGTVAERLGRIVVRVGLPELAPPLGVERYLELMRLDKKSEDGSMRFVVLEAIGKARLQAVAPELVATVVRAHSQGQVLG